MNRDEARQTIIANFDDAEAVAVIENAIASIEAAARVDGLRWCRDLVNVRLPYHEALVAEIDTEIAALERGKEKVNGRTETT